MCNWELSVGNVSEIALVLEISARNMAGIDAQLGIECGQRGRDRCGTRN